MLSLFLARQRRPEDENAHRMVRATVITQSSFNRYHSCICFPMPPKNIWQLSEANLEKVFMLFY